MVINGTHSSWTRVGSGVPQGSILGPILFLLYINDMPDVVTNSLIVMFADNTKCFKVIDSLTALFFRIIWTACLYGLLETNYFFSHPNAIIYASRANAIVFIVIITLVVSEKERYHGVIVCKDTNWAQHLTAIVLKANRMLGFLKRNCAGILDSKALKLLYLSLVHLHLSYCSQVWAPQSVVKGILLIESVQRRATRFICKNNELSYRERLQKLNLLPINIIG